MKPITFGSLFAGIGGIDLGLERAGMECRWQVERDPYCQQVLAKHWPEVKRFDDITDFARPGQRGLRVDLIAGGFPCQPVSSAGRRKAQDDPRWLWPEFRRVLSVVRPRFVLIENVRGLVTAGLTDVLCDLARLGFDAEWRMLSAAELGAPHARQRLLIVAHTRRERVRLDDGWFAGAGGEEDAAALTRRDGTVGAVAGPIAVDGGPRRSANGVRKRPGRAKASQGRQPDADRVGWWTTEPDVDRVANGVPRRMDRIRGLGNAVVPQVAEWVGRRLMDQLAKKTA